MKSMKKYLAFSLCSASLALAAPLYAQTSSGQVPSNTGAAANNTSQSSGSASQSSGESRTQDGKSGAATTGSTGSGQGEPSGGYADAPVAGATTNPGPETGATGSAPATDADKGAPTGSTGSTDTRPSTPATANEPMTTPAPGTPAATDGNASPAGTGAVPAEGGEPKQALSGWSVNDRIIGKAVVNENGEKIGDIRDVVLSSDGQAAYVIIGAGGFLGMGQRDVAVRFGEVELRDDNIVLAGYTKDQLKGLPQVELID